MVKVFDDFVDDATKRLDDAINAVRSSVTMDGDLMNEDFMSKRE